MPKSKFLNRDAVQFGAIVNRLRKQRGWTLVKLARRTGMNPTYLGILEKGGNTPNLSTILELAEVLGVPAGEIIAEVEGARKGARSTQTPSS